MSSINNGQVPSNFNNQVSGQNPTSDQQFNNDRLPGNTATSNFAPPSGTHAQQHNLHSLNTPLNQGTNQGTNMGGGARNLEQDAKKLQTDLERSHPHTHTGTDNRHDQFSQNQGLNQGGGPFSSQPAAHNTQGTGVHTGLGTGVSGLGGGAGTEPYGTTSVGGAGNTGHPTTLPGTGMSIGGQQHNLGGSNLPVPGSVVDHSRDNRDRFDQSKAAQTDVDRDRTGRKRDEFEGTGTGHHTSGTGTHGATTGFNTSGTAGTHGTTTGFNTSDTGPNTGFNTSGTGTQGTNTGFNTSGTGTHGTSTGFNTSGTGTGMQGGTGFGNTSHGPTSGTGTHGTTGFDNSAHGPTSGTGTHGITGSRVGGATQVQHRTGPLEVMGVTGATGRGDTTAHGTTGTGTHGTGTHGTGTHGAGFDSSNRHQTGTTAGMKSTEGRKDGDLLAQGTLFFSPFEILVRCLAHVFFIILTS